MSVLPPTRLVDVALMHDALDDLTLAVRRTLIVMEAAKDRLVDRTYASSPEAARHYHDQVDAHLEVCTTFLRVAFGEMRAVEPPLELSATNTA